MTQRASRNGHRTQSPHLFSGWCVNNSGVMHSVFILCHLAFHAGSWMAFTRRLSRTILAEWHFGRVQNYLKILLRDILQAWELLHCLSQGWCKAEVSEIFKKINQSLTPSIDVFDCWQLLSLIPFSSPSAPHLGKLIRKPGYFLPMGADGRFKLGKLLIPVREYLP